MEKEKIAGKSVEFYTSIDELPYKRFVEFNKYVAIDSGTGSDLQEFDQRMSKIYHAFQLAEQELEAGNTSKAQAHLKKARKEQMNVRQSYQFIMKKRSPKLLSTACLVRSVNGKIYNDLTPEGLQRVVEMLSKENKSVLYSLFERIKKKITQEVQMEESGVNNETFMFYKLLKDQIRALAAEILEDKDNSKEIFRIESELITYGTSPELFGVNAIEKKYDDSYANLKFALSAKLNMDIDRMSTREVIRGVRVLKEMEKKQKI